MNKLMFMLRWALLFAFCGTVWANPDAKLLLRSAREMGAEGRVLWVDGTANLNWLIDRQKVREFCLNASRVGFNEIVLDVKPVSGQTLYKSRIAEPMAEWKGVRVPAEVDILQTFLEEAHAQNLAVSVSINVFSEGHKQVYGAGAAYRHPEWQSIAYVSSRSLAIPGDSINVDRLNAMPAQNQLSVFTNGTAPIPLPSESADTFYLVLDSDLRVTGLSIGSFIKEPIETPEDGFVIVANSAAAFRLRNISIGTTLGFSGQPAFKRIVDADTESIAVFVNPLNPEVRARELGIIKELVSDYPIDGLVLDRMRDSDIHTDFSDLTRQAYELRYGRMGGWPQEIMEIDPVPGKPVKQGRWFARWMEFRASIIRNFLSEVVPLVRSIRPELPIGAYVGSWYDSYYDVGVNWASDMIEPPYEWASPNYRFTGYAEYLDYLMTGCYFKIPFVADAPLYDADEGATVESAARRSVALAGDSTFVYGSIYLKDYMNDPEGMVRAAQAAIASTSGVMVFDSSYLIESNWWDYFLQVFKTPHVKAPHQYPSLIGSLRALRDLGEE